MENELVVLDLIRKKIVIFKETKLNEEEKIVKEWCEKIRWSAKNATYTEYRKFHNLNIIIMILIFIKFFKNIENEKILSLKYYIY